MRSTGVDASEDLAAREVLRRGDLNRFDDAGSGAVSSWVAFTSTTFAMIWPCSTRSPTATSHSSSNARYPPRRRPMVHPERNVYHCLLLEAQASLLAMSPSAALTM